MPPNTDRRSFWQKSNDLGARDFASRASRFLRGHLWQSARQIEALADDPRVARAWRRGWDPDHYRRLRRWADEGFAPQTVFDIGAYQGTWGEMAHAIFRQPRTYFFEPQNNLIGTILARRPKTARVWQAWPVALGDKTEEALLTVTDNRAASSLLTPRLAPGTERFGIGTAAAERVQVARLDDWAAQEKLPAPNLVKIDVQGFEKAVLEGGRSLLRQASRLVIEVSLVPIYENQSLAPEIIGLLAGWGFHLQEINQAARPWPNPPSQLDLWWRKDEPRANPG